MGLQENCERRLRDRNLLSVIVPIYNVVPYLKQCLDSLVRQTYQNLEIILVDDGSTDGSEKICDAYAAQDDRVKVLHQANQGVAVARKHGVEAASGFHLSFVDSDDFVDQDLFQQLMERRQNFDLVVSRWIREDGEQTRMAYDKLALGAYQTPEDMEFLLEHIVNVSSPGGTCNLLSGIVTYVHNKLYKTSLVKQAMAGVDETITFGEDADFLYRYLLLCHSVLFTEICGYHYRIRRGSAAHGLDSTCDYLRNTCKLYESLLPVFQTHPYREKLVEQLQYKMMSLWGKAPGRMGFLPQAVGSYVLPFMDRLAGRQIALYGAGPVGCRYRYQIERNHLCQVVLWVDEDWKNARRVGYEVDAPEALARQNFDYVVIAVWEEEEAAPIQEKLERMGVESEKILWNPPFITA